MVAILVSAEILWISGWITTGLIYQRTDLPQQVRMAAGDWFLLFLVWPLIAFDIAKGE